MSSAYIDIYIGDRVTHAAAQEKYDATCALINQHAAVYGFPPSPPELNAEQREILSDLSKSTPLAFEAPVPLLAGRLVFELSQSRGLSKTVTNFTSLCTGEKGMCKGAKNKPLHYLNVPIHRIVRDFIVQGGDVTRGDGSGGESIYGGKFNDEKEGLKAPMTRGVLAMANSGKNTNSSQFFIVMTEDAGKLAKMTGKYVAFGKMIEGWEVLDRLNAVGSEEGMPTTPVWIGSCGMI